MLFHVSAILIYSAKGPMQYYVHQFMLLATSDLAKRAAKVSLRRVQAG